MERVREIKETVKKSELTAKSQYDYRKLSFVRSHFLNCDIKEEKEEILFTYDIQYLNPFVEIKNENKKAKLAILLGVSKLIILAESYKFSLNPVNLYYDVNRQVLVRQRDIYEAGMVYAEENFIAEYKALIGCVLQKKYRFEDILKGGMQLLKKDNKLKKYYNALTIKELKDLLDEDYQSEAEKSRRTRLVVNKGSYKVLRIYTVFCTLFMVLAAGFSSYLYFWKLPKQESMIHADNAYLEADYVAVIDALEKFSTESIPKHQKYSLAISYVKSENLTAHQKDNILSILTLQEDEGLMDYWIYIGRLNVAEARNIAMLKFDDELLLYAYLKEKFIVETDAIMSGEEKSQKLSELESKIKPLSEQYNSMEEENDNGEE